MQPCPQCNAVITPGATDCSACGALIRPEAPAPVTRDTLDPSDGLIGNLWEGNYSLVKTYWLFGVVGGLALSLAYLILVGVTQSMGVIFFGLLVLIGWQIFSSVAIWRSAGKYTGATVWKVLARAVVVISAVRLLLELKSLTGGA